jgi:molybdopterin-guanine dinucleotide biosynthesis protein A
MSEPHIAGCAGALLAGGRASRLGGIAKGLLRVGGEPIAARGARLLRSLFDEVLLSADDPAPYAALGLTAVPDRLPGKGAPGGLHALLAAARAEWVFVAACDMPFLSEAGIRLLAARRSGADVVLVRWRGLVEPLHAFWSRRCLPLLEARLAGGDPSFRDIAAAVRCAEVGEAEWASIDPEGRAFSNVNTPEDAARLGVDLP